MAKVQNSLKEKKITIRKLVKKFLDLFFAKMLFFTKEKQKPKRISNLHPFPRFDFRFRF